jgi:Lon protease-like protein
MPDTIPLFPLRAVLFPEGALKLRIFETRYVDMIGRCMRDSVGFGVVLILDGMEAGTEVKTVQVGTMANIVDFERLDDGLLGITATGDRRFRITDMRRQADGLNIADVTWMAAETPLDVPPSHEDLASALRELWPRLTEGRKLATPRYDDAVWVSMRLAEILPLQPGDRQRCLEMSDAQARLDYLRARVAMGVDGDTRG